MRVCGYEYVPQVRASSSTTESALCSILDTYIQISGIRKGRHRQPRPLHSTPPSSALLGCSSVRIHMHKSTQSIHTYIHTPQVYAQAGYRQPGPLHSTIRYLLHHSGCPELLPFFLVSEGHAHVGSKFLARDRLAPRWFDLTTCVVYVCMYVCLCMCVFTRM